MPYRPFGKAILDFLPTEGEQYVVPPKDAQPSRVDGPRGFQEFYSEYRFPLTVIQPTRYLHQTIHRLHLASTGVLNINCADHREIWSILTSPWQLTSLKSSPQYSQTVAWFCILKFRNGWVICKKKTVRRRKLSVFNGLRDETRGELGFT